MRTRLLPGVQARVRDAYVAGAGLLHATVAGLVPLADLRGTGPEPGGVAHGEFMRWFAESVRYPAAPLPSQDVRWSAVDEHSAQATGDDAGRATS